MRNPFKRKAELPITLEVAEEHLQWTLMEQEGNSKEYYQTLENLDKVDDLKKKHKFKLDWNKILPAVIGGAFTMAGMMFMTKFEERDNIATSKGWGWINKPKM